MSYSYLKYHLSFWRPEDKSGSLFTVETTKYDVKNKII